MNEYHISANDPKVKEVCRAAFPDYTGTKCRVEFTEGPLDLRSYWDGGSRTYYKILRLGDGKNLGIPTQSAFDTPISGLESFSIPPGFVVVAHVIFCGKDMGLEIFARPDGSQFLPEPKAELSDLEARVVIATCAFKSGYAGCPDYRKAELIRKYNYTSQEIDSARVHLQALGYLDKRLAVTNAGRNAVSNHPDRYHI